MSQLYHAQGRSFRTDGRGYHSAVPHRQLPVQPTERIYAAATKQLKTRVASSAEVVAASSSKTTKPAANPTGVVHPAWKPDFLGKQFTVSRKLAVRAGIVATPGDMAQLVGA